MRKDDDDDIHRLSFRRTFSVSFCCLACKILFTAIHTELTVERGSRVLVVIRVLVNWKRVLLQGNSKDTQMKERAYHKEIRVNETDKREHGMILGSKGGNDREQG